MAWTSPATWAVNAVLTAAQLNTHLRDNLAYLKGVLAGADTDKIPDLALASGINAGKITFGALNGTLLVQGSVGDLALTSGINGAKLSASTVQETAIAFGSKLLGNQSYGVVRYNADLSITNATSFTVNLNIADSLLRATLASNQLTVTDAGVYALGASVVWAQNGTGERIMAVNMSGAGDIVEDTRMAGGNTNFFRQSGSTLRYLSAGTALSLVVYQTSGGALTLKSGASSPFLWAVRLT